MTIDHIARASQTMYIIYVRQLNIKDLWDVNLLHMNYNWQFYLSLSYMINMKMEYLYLFSHYFMQRFELVASVQHALKIWRCCSTVVSFLSSTYLEKIYFLSCLKKFYKYIDNKLHINCYITSTKIRPNNWSY